MPVRLRITLLFTVLVFVILAIVCTSVYFFSSQSRLEIIKKRLTNRAITTARLLSKSEIFDRALIERIDSLTTIALKDKSVRAFNYQNVSIYNYSDLPADTIHIAKELLNEARIRKSVYFTDGAKEAIAYYYTEQNERIVVVCGAEDEEGRLTLRHLKSILLLSLFGGILITIFGGYLFSKSLLQPISKITDELAEITAQNLANRIQTGKIKDEWYKLSATLNDLLNRLQDSFELQRRFISNASHELSTPLTSISSQLEIALQRERSNEHYASVMKTVLEDVRHMNKLTQTLLEFAKASGDKGGLSIDLLRIDEILMQIPASIRRQDANYEISLKFDKLPENENELLLFGNADLLFTAIQNIVINACKYSPDHRAEISLRVTETRFLIDVVDKGIGIPAADIAKIFQPFYRVPNSRQYGFGLGLSLAYRIIKLHKGDIKVQSDPGKCTIFSISLPSAKAKIF